MFLCPLNLLSSLPPPYNVIKLKLQPTPTPFDDRVQHELQFEPRRCVRAPAGYYESEEHRVRARAGTSDTNTEATGRVARQ
jgi:hypothetical protein